LVEIETETCLLVRRDRFSRHAATLKATCPILGAHQVGRQAGFRYRQESGRL